MTILGHHWGEAALGDIQRATEEPWVTVRYAAIRNITPEESLQLSVGGPPRSLRRPGARWQPHRHR